MLRFVVTLTLAVPLAACAADWPAFRGPRGTGISGEKGLPLKWSATENVAWKAAVPGEGWSSPILVGGRVYVGSQSSAGETPGSGAALPQTLHGGPGRAGGGEELGGLVGLRLYLQRLAIQGSKTLVDELAGVAS